MALGPYPDFSISFSKGRTLATCARKYWWQVYGSWEGWQGQLPRGFDQPRPDDSPQHGDNRLAYALKNSKSRFSLAGTIVHQVAQTFVENARLGKVPVTLSDWRTATNDAQVYADTLIDKYLSLCERLAWHRDPKNKPLIVETLYGTHSIDDIREHLRDEIPPLVEALMKNGHLRLIANLADKGHKPVVFCEELDSFRLDVPELGGVRVWVIADLVYRVPEDHYVIVDWKTGKRYPGGEQQAAIYAAWLASVRQVRPEQMSTSVAYLREGLEDRHDVDAMLIDNVLDELRVKAKEAAALVDGGNIAVNAPRTRDEAFPMLPANSRECRWCDFRRLCGRG